MLQQRLADGSQGRTATVKSNCQVLGVSVAATWLMMKGVLVVVRLQAHQGKPGAGLEGLGGLGGGGNG